jgi:hypothetical protein
VEGRERSSSMSETTICNNSGKVVVQVTIYRLLEHWIEEQVLRE